MHNLSDRQLLRAYAEKGSEAAFAEIVLRHTDLVYSAALRQVGSPDLARDVAQTVFSDLARKAAEVSARLSPKVSLVGWLYRGTRFAARDLHRNETRRTKRERQAMAELQSTPENPTDWEKLDPALDDAMADLSDPDREAVLLRYFRNQDLRAVGAALGISDDAAQKRVTRAVDRLREMLVRRGVSIGTSGLAAMISANAVHAAPAGLALAIPAAAFTGTALGTATTAAITKAITMTSIQKAFFTVTVAALAAGGIYKALQVTHLRDQVQMLQAQQADQLRQFQNERDAAASRLSELTDGLMIARENNADLLRLRGEVTMLRRRTNELALMQSAAAQSSQPSATPTSDPGQDEHEFIPREEYQFAGFGDPKAAALSFHWAFSQGDFQKLLSCISPAQQLELKQTFAGWTEEEIRAALLNDADNRRVGGYLITQQSKVSEDDVVLTIFQEGRQREKKMRFVRVGDEWKFDGSPGR